MKPTSKYFDSIRNIKSSAKKKPAPPKHVCSWNGCEEPGTHKAPLGRDSEGQYIQFCIKHVREYNKNFNYFSGLDDDAIAKFQKENITGQRPTWEMASNPNGSSKPANASIGSKKPYDPAAAGADRLYKRGTLAAEIRAGRLSSNKQRKLKTLEKKSFDDMGLQYNAMGDEIKKRYKDLVKQNHPDANGGDRSSEERLRKVITAYKHLQKAGFC